MDIASLNIKVTNNGLPENNAGLTNLKTNATGAAKAVDQFEQSSRRGAGGVSAFNRVLETSIFSIKNLIGTYSALQAIKMTDTWVLLKGRIEQSTESIEEADEAWKGLLDTARETGQIEASVAIFQRLSFVRDEIKATTDEMLQFTETVQKLGMVGGASQDALKFGLTQLGQSLSSDIVRAEEFNSIMENIPSVGRAIADELGVSTGQLRLLVIEGKLASSDVFAAILNQTEKAREQFEALPMTAGRAWDQFKMALMESLGIMNEHTGATDVLIGFLYRAGEAAKALGWIVMSIGSAFEAMSTAIGGGFLYLINLCIEAINKFGDAVADVYNATSRTLNKYSFGAIDIGERQGVNLGTVGGGSAAIGAEFNDEMGGIGRDWIGATNKLFPGQGEEKSSAIRKITTDYKALVEGLKEGNKEEEKAQKLIAKTISDLKFKNEQMGRSVEDQEVYNQLRQANVEIDSAAGKEIENLVRLNQAMKREQEALNKVVDAGEGAFKKLWKSGISGAEDWRETMRSIIDDVADMFYDLVIKSQVQNFLKGVIGGGSSGGGGIFGSLLGGLGGLFGGGSSVPSGAYTAALRGASNPALFGPGFADGGSFQVGGVGGTDSQLVQFRASPDETVSITRPGQGNGGGNTIHLSIDARGADAGVEERIMRAVSALDKTLEGRALNAVNTQFKRNPTYGRRT